MNDCKKCNGLCKEISPLAENKKKPSSRTAPFDEDGVMKLAIFAYDYREKETGSVKINVVEIYYDHPQTYLQKQDSEIKRIEELGHKYIAGHTHFVDNNTFLKKLGINYSAKATPDMLSIPVASNEASS